MEPRLLTGSKIFDCGTSLQPKAQASAVIWEARLPGSKWCPPPHLLVADVPTDWLPLFAFFLKRASKAQIGELGDRERTEQGRGINGGRLLQAHIGLLSPAIGMHY